MKTRGGNNLAAYHAGRRLTQRQAILAKCADCMGGFHDGRIDCLIPACPLYPWMPYRVKTQSSAGNRKLRAGSRVEAAADGGRRGGRVVNPANSAPGGGPGVSRATHDLAPYAPTRPLVLWKCPCGDQKTSTGPLPRGWALPVTGPVLCARCRT